MRRSLLISAALVLASPSMWAASAKADNTEFVSGTIKSIPSKTKGALDISDPSELRFRYANSVYAIPYGKISNAQVVEPVGHHLWKLPVPPMGKTARLLSISFRDGDATSMVTFRAPAGEALAVARTIDERRTDPKLAAVPSTPGKETWWGDRYWRTNRNKDKWPSPQPAENTGIPAGTK